VRDLIATRGRRCEEPRCDAPNVGADQKLYGDHVNELRDGGAPLDPANVTLGVRRVTAARRRRKRRRGWRGDGDASSGAVRVAKNQVTSRG
jgi:5-methylcytosine-specific restriction enzyme A